STLDAFEQTLQARRSALLQKAQQIDIVPDVQASFVRGPAIAAASTGAGSGAASSLSARRSPRKKSKANLVASAVLGIVGIAATVLVVMNLPSGEPSQSLAKSETSQPIS